MAALWAGVWPALCWLLAAIGWLLLALLVLVLIVLFVPAFAEISYQNETIEVYAGMLFIKLKVYPWQWSMKSKKEKEQPKSEKKVSNQKAGKGAKITLNAIKAALAAAGMATKLIVGALRVRKIKLFLPVHTDDAAQTAILYGKISAWVYGMSAFLNHFLYLDFEEIEITPFFEEKFERTAYFSCKVTAQLFIMVVVAIRLILMLQKEKELLALFVKKQPNS